jgi:type VI secretion system secreted protein VgrG
MGGGSYINITSQGIEPGTSEDIRLKNPALQKMGEASNNLSKTRNNNHKELELLLKK